MKYFLRTSTRRIFPPVILILFIGLACTCSPLSRFSTPSRPATSPATSPTTTQPLGIGSTRARSRDGMVMVYVSAGDFLMGSSTNHGDGESPQHTVTLDAFWIDKTDVTNGMYALCVQTGDCQPPAQSSSKSRPSYYGNSQYADYPVIEVTWAQANLYCSWAGARLPTEAEWEKAARGTDGRTYPWGNQAPTCSLANYGPRIGSPCVGDTSAAGSNPANASPYGALDMAGNVGQWVADWWDENYYASSPTTNPTGPSSGSLRVFRGGSWIDNANIIRAAFRGMGDPTVPDEFEGFRCALSP